MWQSKPKKIAVIRLSSLGDVILTTPVFESIRHSFPKIKLTVITKEQYRDVFAHNPFVDEVIAFGKHENIFSLVMKIRKKYDLIIDLHANIRSRFLSLFSGSPAVRYSKNSLERYLLVYFKKYSPGLQTTVVNRYLDALAPLSLPEQRKIPRLYLSEQEVQQAKKFLKEHNVKSSDVIVGLNPGARWKTKKWPLSYWLELIKLLAQENYKMILFGDARDRQDIGEVLKANEQTEKIIVATGQTTLRQLFSLIKLCNLLITGDSGPLHCAQALDVPAVMLLGPTVPEFGFIHPREHDVALSLPLDCRPCSLHGTDTCMRGGLKCLKDIQPEEVLEAVQTILKGSKKRK